ncbi:MAG: tRNA (adenosine(37)-N6)-threonylcarbamoyltransferase complex ATPase subunit type 1 TsaE, partial [Calditrichaeota bacterium]
HEGEATDIGFDEYVQSGGICFIEWPERVQNLLPAERYEIHLDGPDYANRPTARTLLIRRT